MKYKDSINFNFVYYLTRNEQIFELNVSGTVYESCHDISITLHGKEFEVTDEELELIKEEMRKEVSFTTSDDLIEEYDDEYDSMKDEGQCLHY